MQTFLRLLAFGSSLLVCFFFRTMKMLMMMLILLTENNTAKEKKKKRRKRSSYFLTNTHTLSLSLCVCVCVCVCRFLSENSLPRVTAVSALLYIISDEKRKKDILQRKRKESKKCTRIRVEDPKQKNRHKSLWTKIHRRNKKRPIIIKRERER